MKAQRYYIFTFLLMQTRISLKTSLLQLARKEIGRTNSHARPIPLKIKKNEFFLLAV